MALVSAGYFANVVLVDAAGNKSTLRYDVVASDLATALTNTQTIVSALDALTDAVIVGYSVGQRYEENADFYGAAGSEVENIAQVVCQLEGTPIKYHNFRIPAPISGLFEGTSGPSRNQVDIDNANLETYIGLFTDKTGYGTPGADAIALVSDGEKVAPDTVNDEPEIVSGKRIHRASTKG